MEPAGEAGAAMTRDEMLRAFMARDAGADGRFMAAVTSTGIFCRPGCPARKPKPENVQFYSSAREALFAGFRPCLRCRPMEAEADPPWLAPLLSMVESDPERRFADRDLRAAGLEPAGVRRFFKRAYGISFQAYSRARRLGRAFSALKAGADIDEAVFSSGYESHSAFREAFGKRFGFTPGASKARSGDGPREGRIVLGWIETPLGPMVAGASGEALCLLEFTERRMLEAQFLTLRKRFAAALEPGESPVIETARVQLGEYFMGKRKTFDMALAAPGTPFQERVWEGLGRIPFGQTRSYAQLAAELGQPGASRAVGTANGLNRIAIIIPCHRVIEAGGGLGGYGGGLWRKLRLLELEGSR
jgi:AraC family transcriptional regulator of adaptative response/methylated-DNA-[protein]-cysteine methyltransferase